MLDEFRGGKDTAQAIQAALKISPGAVRREIRRRTSRRELGAVVAQARALAGEARPSSRRPSQAEDWRLVAAKAAEAIELFPDYVDEGSPYIAKARAHRELGETALLTNTLLEYRSRGGYDPDALIALARALGDAEPHRRMRSTCSRTC